MDSPENSITHLESRIVKLQRWLSSHPYSHPERCCYLFALANVRVERLNLLHWHTNEDFDNVILHLTEAVLIPLHPLGLDIISCLLMLARFLSTRFPSMGQPRDLKSSIEYFHHLLNLDLPPRMRKDITVDLVEALRAHVKLEAGSIIHSTEEILALCRELLTLNISGSDLVDVILVLKDFVYSASGGSWEEPLDQVIEYMREAIEMCPSGSYSAFIAMSETLANRFTETHSIRDLQEAMALIDKVIASQPLGDEQNPDRLEALFLAAKLSVVRSVLYQNLQHLEEAISRVRNSLVYYPPGHNRHSILIQHLADLTKKRSSYFHLTVHPQPACSDTPQEMGTSAPQRMSTSGRDPVGWDATKGTQMACSLVTIDQQIQNLHELLSGTAPGPSGHAKYFLALADWYSTRFDRTDDIMDLEKCIEWRQMQLVSTPRDPHLQSRLTNLGLKLLQAFQRNHRISFLEGSIPLLRYAIQVGDVGAQGTQGIYHLQAFQALHLCLLLRWRLICHREDLDEAILLLQKSIDHESSEPPDKLQDACTWANLARETAHPSVSTAYKIAMSWMQRSLVFAPTLHTKHAHLVAIRRANKMPLAYASHQIETDHLEQAVEILEQGRALLWSEMRGLRTSIDQISVANPAYATKLSIVNRDLETLTMSIPLEGNGGTDWSGAQGEEGGMDMFGQLLKKQRTLLDERDILTSQIQALSGFENFLKTPSFDTLRAAAKRGPVIIVNHCEWRSDIIIVLHHSPPFLIATRKHFYDRANELADRLLDTRKKHRLESSQYQHTLRSVLKELYELVGQPVIDKLRELNIPEQSRVWWCPTSVFCSLPLHAMGPILSQDKVKMYFSDIYISSYTPTLSALIKSREPGVQTTDLPSLLVIAPPDKSLPGVRKEIGVIKQVLGSSIRNSILGEATSENAAESLRHHRFAHFACHGVLEAGKPFDASFKLQGGDRLTLLNIVRSQLPAAEFAFLSACHTAELTDGSIPDEALHLTTAMQYCGFRSVVGTMWAMADTDGQDLAGYFYKLMFSPSEDQDVPYYERSAKALRDAVQKLRREKRVGLERWVNFVHYGA